MSEAPNWFFSMCAFIRFVCCAIPLLSDFKGLQCLNRVIKSVIWNSSVINVAPIWCNISSRFMIGAVVALSAASLCINQRPYHIVLVDVVTKTRAEKRRDVLVGLAIGLGIPILEMILHEYRFNIFEEIECYLTTYNIPPPHALVRCWPTMIGIVSAAYCCMAQFKELLSANQNMSSSQYFCLMGLAVIEVLGMIHIGAYTIYLNMTVRANTHYDFSCAAQYPSVIWHADHQMAVSLQMSQYLFVTCTFIFFSFFGFADEAR
ncbi:STE3-like pheromone receptor [Pisolithus marmoratus]|nr:STE3-like pheromone receptor [Pisolithus marmoratus]